MTSPVLIDGLQFARDGAALQGTLGQRELPRLREQGGTTAGLKYVLSGRASAEGVATLQVRSSGTVVLTCQRCLEPIDYPIDIDVELVLTTDPAQIDAAEDDVDRVLATKAMDAPALVEDEVLLALPMVPRHEACQAPSVEEHEVLTTNPFASLKARKH